MGKFKMFSRRGLTAAATLAVAVTMTAVSATAATNCTPGTPGYNKVVHHAAVYKSVKNVVPGTAAVTKKVTVTTPGKAAVTEVLKQFKDFVAGTPAVNELSAKLFRHIPGGDIHASVWLGPNDTVVNSPNQAAFIPVSKIGPYTFPNGPAGGNWSPSDYTQGPTAGTPDATYYLVVAGNGVQSKSTVEADASWVGPKVSVGPEWTSYNTKTVVVTPATPPKTTVTIVVVTPAKAPVTTWTKVLVSKAYATNVWVPATARHCVTVKDNSAAAAAHAKAVAKAKAAAHARSVAQAKAKSHAMAVAKAKAAAQVRAEAAQRAAKAAAQARAEAAQRAANAKAKAHSNVPDARTGLGDNGGQSTPWGGIAGGAGLIAGAGLVLSTRKRENQA